MVPKRVDEIARLVKSPGSAFVGFWVEVRSIASPEKAASGAGGL